MKKRVLDFILPSLLLLLLPPLGATAATVTFTRFVIDAAPSNGAVLERAWADIKGVGHLDAVVGFELDQAGRGTGGIVWYEYPVSGNKGDVWQKHTIIGHGAAYEDMLAYDVNGDGAVDIVASIDVSGTNSGSSVVWFENPRGHGGDPAVDVWVMHTIGAGSGENTLRLIDVDGDGKNDIVSNMFVYFQNSPTSWTTVGYSASTRGVALLDIGSGKGSINLVGTGPAPFDIVWFENPREHGGNARTDPWILHRIGPGYPCGPGTTCPAPQIATFNSGDFNRDGRMDVVSAQSEGDFTPPPGGLMWWEAPEDRRNGTWIQHTIDPTYQSAHKVQVTDIDGDGTLDLVTAEQDQSVQKRVSVFYNDGLGNFKEQVLATTAGHNVAIGDVDTDGDTDILNSAHGFWGGPHPIELFVNNFKSSSGNPAPVSDEFNTNTINSALWKAEDPGGVASFGANGTEAVISVPPGTPHDLWTDGNFSARLTQSVTDGDLTMEAKFDSAFTAGYQMQGLLMQHDASNYLRFENYFDGQSPHLYVASFHDDVPTPLLDVTIPNSNGSVWLRVMRRGDSWTQSWSTDGVHFQNAITVVYGLNLTRAGVYAGNQIKDTMTAPGFSAKVDYVHFSAP